MGGAFRTMAAPSEAPFPGRVAVPALQPSPSRGRGTVSVPWGPSRSLSEGLTGSGGPFSFPDLLSKSPVTGRLSSQEDAHSHWAPRLSLFIRKMEAGVPDEEGGQPWGHGAESSPGTQSQCRLRPGTPHCWPTGRRAPGCPFSVASRSWEALYILGPWEVG